MVKKAPIISGIREGNISMAVWSWTKGDQTWKSIGISKGRRNKEGKLSYENLFIADYELPMLEKVVNRLKIEMEKVEKGNN